MEVSDERMSFPASAETDGDEEAVDQKGALDVATWGELMALAAPEWRWIALGCIALLIRLPFSLASPHFQSEAIGSAIKGDGAELRWNVILLMATGVVNACLDFWNVFLFDFAKAKLLRRLRVHLFEVMLAQERAYMDATSSGWLMSRLVADTGEMGNDLTWVFRWSIESVVRISGIVAYMFFRDWRLALVAVTIVPPCTLANTCYGRWLRSNASKVQAALAAAGARSNEALNASSTVAACAAEAFEVERYARRILDFYRLSVAQAAAQAAYYMVCYSLLVGTCVPAALLWVGGRRVAQDRIPPSVLIAFMLYQGQLLEYTGQLLNSITSLLKSSGSGGEVFRLLRRKPDTPHARWKRSTPRHPRDQDPLRTPLLAAAEQSEEGHRLVGRVELRQVSFTYMSRPNELALKQVSLVAKPATYTAIVGASGSGKSTLLRLVLAFYGPTDGLVLLDDAPVASYEPAFLRGQALGMVAQEPLLMDGTVMDNILYGIANDRCRSREGAVAAALVANAHAFIEALPDKYDTRVGERGGLLSGGQKQRICIARAIARDPAVLLLDEATSALDVHSVNAVQNALHSAAQGRTTISVSHNLASVKDAHSIVRTRSG